MPHLSISAIFLLLAAGLTVSASSVPTTTLSMPIEITTSLITPAPYTPVNKEFLKRQDSSEWICGHGANGHGFSGCPEDSWCAGTVLPDGKGWKYCSTSGLVDHAVQTTAFANWRGENCPRSAVCCRATDTRNQVATALFQVEGYDFTVTGWFCAKESGHTSTYHAVRKVLNPTSISKALVALPTEPPPALSTGEQAAIGVGLGIGIGLGAPIVILGAVVHFRRRRRRQRQLQEKGGVQAGSPVQPSSPHADYSWYKEQAELRAGTAELNSNERKGLQ